MTSKSWVDDTPMALVYRAVGRSVGPYATRAAHPLRKINPVKRALLAGLNVAVTRPITGGV